MDMQNLLMFQRISISRASPISAFAGGNDHTTILSSCGNVLETFFSPSAATPLRLVHRDFLRVFKPPSQKLQRYSIKHLETQTQRGGVYYNQVFQMAPELFLDAFHYMFTMRNIPLNPYSTNVFFINDSTFRGILIKLHQKFRPDCPFDIFYAPDLHHLVNVMSWGMNGINPHAFQLLNEVSEHFKLSENHREKY